MSRREDIHLGYSQGRITYQTAVKRINQSYGSPIPKQSMISHATTALRYQDEFLRAPNKEAYVNNALIKLGVAVTATILAIFAPTLFPVMKALMADTAARVPYRPMKEHLVPKAAKITHSARRIIDSGVHYRPLKAHLIPQEPVTGIIGHIGHAGTTVKGWAAPVIFGMSFALTGLFTQAINWGLSQFTPQAVRDSRIWLEENESYVRSKTYMSGLSAEERKYMWDWFNLARERTGLKRLPYPYSSLDVVEEPKTEPVYDLFAVARSKFKAGDYKGYRDLLYDFVEEGRITEAQFDSALAAIPAETPEEESTKDFFLEFEGLLLIGDYRKARAKLVEMFSRNEISKSEFDIYLYRISELEEGKEDSETVGTGSAASGGVSEPQDEWFVGTEYQDYVQKRRAGLPTEYLKEKYPQFYPVTPEEIAKTPYEMLDEKSRENLLSLGIDQSKYNSYLQAKDAGLPVETLQKMYPEFYDSQIENIPYDTIMQFFYNMDDTSYDPDRGRYPEEWTEEEYIFPNELYNLGRRKAFKRRYRKN